MISHHFVELDELILKMYTVWGFKHLMLDLKLFLTKLICMFRPNMEFAQS